RGRAGGPGCRKRRRKRGPYGLDLRHLLELHQCRMLLRHAVERSGHRQQDVDELRGGHHEHHRRSRTQPQGQCRRRRGESCAAPMAEIASYGYFVVADGTPDGDGSRSLNSSDVVSMGAPLIAYIDWAVAENDKPCSAYHGRLDPTKIASNGFSCGGLMAAGTAGDPRITTWGHTSSGLFSSDAGFYAMVHTPVLIVEGGPSDIAYENGLRDYQNISELD